MNRKDCDNQHHQHPRCAARALCHLAGAVLLLCCAVVAEAATVRVRSTALIDESDVRLGAVAVLEGFPAEQLEAVSVLVVEPAPRCGESRTVTLAAVREALQAYGVNMATVCLKGARQCQVRRPAQLPKMPEDTTAAVLGDGAGLTLRHAIGQWFEAQLGDYGGAVKLTFEEPAKPLLALAGPTYTFDIRTLGRRLLGSQRLKVLVRAGPSSAQTHNISVKAVLRKGVVVAARGVSRGQIISAADVLLEERPFERLEHIGVQDLAAVIGQESRREWRVGEMIQASDLRLQLLVKRNDIVQVRSAVANIVVASAALALRDGVLGDVIEVLNSSSEEVFQVRVTGLRRGEAISAGVSAQHMAAGGTP